MKPAIFSIQSVAILGIILTVLNIAVVKAQPIIPAADGTDLTTVSPRDIGRLLDRGDIPEASFFIDIHYSPQVGSYVNQKVRRDLQSFTAIQQKLTAIFNQTGKKPAIIYTLVRPEQLDLIIVPPSGIPINKSIPAARREALREVVTNSGLKSFTRETQFSELFTTSPATLPMDNCAIGSGVESSRYRHASF
jgi:hypothetical protein